MAENESLPFDENADRYEAEVDDALRAFGGEVDFFALGKAEHLSRQATLHFGRLDKLRLLDVGCGVGLLHPHLLEHFDRLTGVDVAEKAIVRARSRNPEADYLTYDGSVLPFSDASFEIACAVCVLHHVEPRAWLSFWREMFRVVAPGGLVAIFEHNPYNPLTRAVVKGCHFDHDAVLLSAGRARDLLEASGFIEIRTHHLFFTPWRARLLRWLDRRLSWLPLGAQYCVVGRKPSESESGRPSARGRLSGDDRSL